MFVPSNSRLITLSMFSLSPSAIRKLKKKGQLERSRKTCQRLAYKKRRMERDWHLSVTCQANEVVERREAAVTHPHIGRCIVCQKPSMTSRTLIKNAYFPPLHLHFISFSFFQFLPRWIYFRKLILVRVETVGNGKNVGWKFNSIDIGIPKFL